MAAAVQPPTRGQILMKMEASASSATSIEKNEPPAAWPSTLSTRVLQLPADGHHLDGHICSSLSFAAAAPTCSGAMVQMVMLRARLGRLRGSALL